MPKRITSTVSILESAIERSFARRCPFPCLKFGGPGERGKTDRIVFVIGGKPWLVEFKRPGEMLTPLQAHWQGRMRKLGYRVFTIDSKEMAEDHLKLLAYYKRTHNNLTPANKALPLPTKRKRAA